MNSDAPRGCILLIHTDAIYLTRLAQALESRGHTTHEAIGCTEAIREAELVDYDLVILPIDLISRHPELLGQLREKDHTLGALVVADASRAGEAIRASRGQSCEIILEPFESVELHEAVDSALTRQDDESELSRLRAIAPLFESGREISSLDDVDRLAHQILNLAMEQTAADGGSLMLVDDKSDTLYIEASRGISPEIAVNARPRIGEGIAGWVAQHNLPMQIAPGTSPGILLNDAALNRRDVASSISVPIVIAPPGTAERLTLGVLNLNKREGKRPFSQGDLDLLSLLCSQVAVALRSMQLYSNLRGAYLGIIRALASAVDAKDAYTAGHSERVSLYATSIARQMQLSDGHIEAIKHAGLLHDIGKIGVADAILKKPGRLTEDEFREMRNHAGLSHSILAPVDLPHDIKPMVRHHHEWYNGSGYPDGLAANDIPLGARILSIADAFEAMTSDRPYRLALPRTRAVKELQNYSGSQFDPHIVETFVETLPDKVESFV